MQRTFLGALFAIVSTLALSGCESSECKRMRTCCAAIAEEPWVGGACGEIAQGIRNPDSCRSVMDAIKASAADKQLPAACTQ